MPADPIADFDLLIADRPDLAELSIEQISAIESRTDGWPEVWRDFARSQYVTLISRPQPMPASTAVALAVDLTLGIVADMPGAQPYIAAGDGMKRSAKTARMMELLRLHRQDYDRVGKLVGLSPRQVRRLESCWLRAERAKRQGTLAFD
jgi:hypothetical protein